MDIVASSIMPVITARFDYNCAVRKKEKQETHVRSVDTGAGCKRNACDDEEHSSSKS